jgi:hypothetical protein
VAKQLECELCGAVYTNAEKHQTFHDDISAWIHLIELEVDARIRWERRREA